MSHGTKQDSKPDGLKPGRLLISAYISIAFLALALLFPGSAAAQQAYSGNFTYDNPEGDLVVPLPPGSWRKALVHNSAEVIDMGTNMADWNKGNVFLIRTKDGKADAVITLNANRSGIDGERLDPPEFCYAKQRSWKYHKQYRVIARDTYCWGVTTARLPITAESEAEAWQEFMEKNAASKWGIGEDTPARQVRFLRWVSGRFMRIDYYFLAPKGGKLMDWREARKWARSIADRVKAGFEGKASGGK